MLALYLCPLLTKQKLSMFCNALEIHIKDFINYGFTLIGLRVCPLLVLCKN